MLYSIVTKQVLIIVFCITYFVRVLCNDSFISRKYSVSCFDKYIPKNCNYPNITLDAIATVADLDRCGPAVLEIKARNLFWSAGGRKFTYLRNFKSFERITITPRILQDISQSDISTVLLKNTIAMPIGISPTAAHRLAHPDGEIGSAKAAASSGALYILSALSQTKLESVAKAAFSINKEAQLWLHALIMKNRTLFREYLQRGEQAGFKAVVVTVDYPVRASISCNASSIYDEIKFPHIKVSDLKYGFTFQDLEWIVKTSRIPVVVKGIMSVEAALLAVNAGASAIFISNEGGRLIDGGKSTVEVLHDIATVIRCMHPSIEIYIDGGVRSGSDVFKVLALGAKAAFVGRPVVWGLAIAVMRIRGILELKLLAFYGRER